MDHLDQATVSILIAIDLIQVAMSEGIEWRSATAADRTGSAASQRQRAREGGPKPKMAALPGPQIDLQRSSLTG
ncbi:hypothetical protein GCM10022224_031820 [Nonomuraea antimicrobica]|uniref:Transposase n=1 Tax=Nonomuraea antimicrobica TaxID=561173 RepID=A0ABP7BPU6_9ACTN